MLTHPLYLAPVPFYAQLFAAGTLIVDDTSPFVKQTFRNRTIITAENGAQTLTIPVVHNGNQAMRDVRISEHGNWRHLHWNAMVSAYRKSPFFDYYADDFAHFYEERDGFLMDFNMRLHNVVCELLGIDKKVVFITEGMDCSTMCDMRNIAEPKALAAIGSLQPYYQVFAMRNGFIPNASIADLLFNMGPEALIVLRDCITQKAAF